MGRTEVDREEDEGEAHHVSAQARIRKLLMLSIIIRIMMRRTYTESTDMARDGLHWQKRTCLSSLSVCFIIVVLIVINIVVVIVVIMVWKS